MSKKNLPLVPLDVTKGVALFTDGSSSSRDKSGGWAWVAIDAYDGEMSDSGGESLTTNNRMEMTAWIEGLQTIFLLFGACRVIVYSDSEYVGLGAMDRERNRHKNKDLWEQIDQVIDDHLYVEFNHIKGHSGDTINEIVDKMAGEARKVHRDKIKNEPTNT